MQQRSEKYSVVFIHTGDAPYLRYTLSQAKISNPDSRIILIGDINNDKYDFVEHYFIEKYAEEADLFSKLYKHHSSNPYHFEIFCFIRWFILKEFMVQHNIKKCVYLDSDVMLYADMLEEQTKFRDYYCALSQRVSPHVNIINNLYVLAEYCDLTTKCFAEPSLYNKVVEIAKEQSFSMGCLSDMVLWYEYQRVNSHKVGDLLSIDNKRYDHHISISEGFEMDQGIKKITWIDDKPFCTNISDKELIMFNCLHFQGSAKKHIQNYFTGSLQYLAEKEKWSICSSLMLMRIRRMIKNIHEEFTVEEFENVSTSIDQAILEYPYSPDLMTLKAELMLRTGNLEEAAKILSYVIDFHPAHIEALNNLAVLLCYKKDYKEAMRLLRKVLKLNPSNKDALQNILFIQNEILVSKARTFAQKGNLMEAMAILKKILSTDDQHIEALNLLGGILIKKGKLEEAKEKLAFILQIDPTNEEAIRNLEHLNTYS